MDTVYLVSFSIAVILSSYFIGRIILIYFNSKLHIAISVVPVFVGIIVTLLFYLYELIFGSGKFSYIVLPIMFILTVILSVIGVSINALGGYKSKN